MTVQVISPPMCAAYSKSRTGNLATEIKRRHHCQYTHFHHWQSDHFFTIWRIRALQYHRRHCGDPPVLVFFITVFQEARLLDKEDRKKWVK